MVDYLMVLHVKTSELPIKAKEIDIFLTARYN